MMNQDPLIVSAGLIGLITGHGRFSLPGKSTLAAKEYRYEKGFYLHLRIGD